MSPYGVGTNVYATVLAYRTDAFKGKKAPASWADLWNVKDMPGRRAIRKHPFDTLEESLMAAGVPTSQLYPLNIDRAFANLDKIKPNVAVWWNSRRAGDAAPHLGRSRHDRRPGSRAPQAAIMEGAPVAIVWNQNLWGVDNWSILAGTPNADACREFIKFASDVKRMAQQGDFYPGRRHAARGVQVHEGRNRQELADATPTTSRPACRSTPNTGSRTRRRSPSASTAGS